MSTNNNQIFTKEELERYSRHLIIPEFNIEGQKKLKQAKVLVVGTGGLGAPLLQYLAAAGVGTIGVLDFDRVDASNLQRQVLFNVHDVGKPKVEVAVERLSALNPFITLIPHNVRLTSENALDIISKYDIVADGTDNFPTRYLVNDACILTGKVNVYASIFRFEGQVSVFNYRYADGTFGPNYRDLFPEPPPPGLVPSCAEGGVLGVLPGIIGALQANEVIKVITGLGKPLVGKLFILDALTMQTRTLHFDKDDTNPLTGKNPTLTGLIDYEEFCGITTPSEKEEEKQSAMKELTVKELKEMIDRGEDFQLIDIREPYERDIVHIGGEHIPMAQLPHNTEIIRTEVKTVIYCRSGGRSAQMVRLLQERFGFNNLYNLKGGVLAWAREIDQSLPVY